MLDTFMVKIKLTTNQRNLIYNAVNAFVKETGSKSCLYLKKAKKHCRWYVTAAFNDKGILELAIEDYWYPGNRGSILYLKCKPAQVLHFGEVYALSDYIDYAGSACLVDAFITRLNQYMPEEHLEPLAEWKVHRIDYAYQFRTEEYDLYMALMQKQCPNRENCYSDSIYIKKSKYHINFYNKTKKLKRNETSHVLRFEVQCNADYLYKMRAEERIQGLSLRDLWKEEIAAEIVKKKMIKVIGYGDFYSVETAIPVLQEATNTRFCEKEAMIMLMRLSLHPLANKDLIWDEFALAGGLEEVDIKFRKRIEHLQKRLNINLVAIPESIKITKLLNPVKMIPEFEKIRDNGDL